MSAWLPLSPIAILGLLAPPPKIAPLEAYPLIGRPLWSIPQSTNSLADLTASADLTLWHALSAGRMPDFSGVDSAIPWPPQPLRGALSDAMSSLGWPRTVGHPSLVPAVLVAMAKRLTKYCKSWRVIADLHGLS